jgi:hypothetical protein
MDADVYVPVYNTPKGLYVAPSGAA